MRYRTLKTYAIGSNPPRIYTAEANDLDVAERRLRFLTGDYSTPRAQFMEEIPE